MMSFLGLGSFSASNSLESQDDTPIYWEKQSGSICGRHALNALLQGPYTDELSLATIATELDESERALMMASGDLAAMSAFLAQESVNVDDSGNFSITVLRTFLERGFGLELDSTPSTVEAVMRDPSQFDAFMLNFESHWFSLRKLPTRSGPKWFNLNSLNKKGPEIVSDFFLSAFLAQLRSQGYFIFAVKPASALPPPMKLSSTSSSGSSSSAVTSGLGAGGAAIMTVSQIMSNTAATGPGGSMRDAADERKRAAQRAREAAAEDPEMAAALQASLQGTDFADYDEYVQATGGNASQKRAKHGGEYGGEGMGGFDVDGGDEDEELRRAIAASMGASSASSTSSSSGAGSSSTAAGRSDAPIVLDDDDEDAQLKAALAMSMDNAGSSSSTSSSGSGSSIGPQQPQARPYRYDGVTHEALAAAAGEEDGGAAAASDAASGAGSASSSSSSGAAAVAAIRLQLRVPAPAPASTILDAKTGKPLVAPTASAAPQLTFQRRFARDAPLSQLFDWAALCWLASLGGASAPQQAVVVPRFSLVGAGLPPRNLELDDDAWSAQLGPASGGSGAVAIANALGGSAASASLILKPKA